ncbi:unnamed protein product, partial [Polarella glacialis]
MGSETMKLLLTSRPRLAPAALGRSALMSSAKPAECCPGLPPARARTSSSSLGHLLLVDCPSRQFASIFPSHQSYSATGAARHFASGSHKEFRKKGRGKGRSWGRGNTWNSISDGSSGELALTVPSLVAAAPVPRDLAKDIQTRISREVEDLDELWAVVGEHLPEHFDEGHA